MALRHEQDYSDDQNGFEPHYHDDDHPTAHEKKVRQMLEDRLDRKRLKKELDDFDGEFEDVFDWEDTKP